MKTIHVTKSFLPPYDEYCAQIEKIWSTNQLTNQGPLLLEFESAIKNYLKIQNFHFVTNGTMALQLALSALNINDGEVITTPFSYVATTSAILWQRCTPVFVDITDDDFTINVQKIEAAITPQTKAILAVHVFGHACNVLQIQKIADKHNLKVIYDGAHAFASRYKGKSLYEYGDISTLSFHATKLFHTIEGGGCVVKDEETLKQMNLQKKFGHIEDEHFCLGINAKASEFQAAMGLTNLPYVAKNIQARKDISSQYDAELKNVLTLPKKHAELEYNYAYYPVIFASEAQLLNTLSILSQENIFLRRYFYPSLNLLPYLQYQSCPVSEDICSRIACLPLYPSLLKEDITRITKLIKKAL